MISSQYIVINSENLKMVHETNNYERRINDCIKYLLALFDNFDEDL